MALNGKPYNWFLLNGKPHNWFLNQTTESIVFSDSNENLKNYTKYLQWFISFIKDTGHLIVNDQSSHLV